MGTILRLASLSIILPLFLFLLITVPKINGLIEQRLPLVTLYYLAAQLDLEIAAAKSDHYGLPPRFRHILREYNSLRNHPAVIEARDLSGDFSELPLSERFLARIILTRRNLPVDLLTSDPVHMILTTLDTIAREERRLEVQRSDQIQREALLQIKRYTQCHFATVPIRQGLPPGLIDKGLIFCREYVPLGRSDVRRRIEQEIEYLLSEFRSDTTLWLKRRDRYSAVVENILDQESVPKEFALLPALESGYNRSVLSPSNARGWWQFVRPTAVRSSAKHASLDWAMNVDRYFDQRCDLAVSTKAAARYLKWMRKRISRNKGTASWLTVAAAYNAGLTAVIHRAQAYDTLSYWNMKLPHETEVYVPRWIAFTIIDSHRDYYCCSVDRVPPLDFDTIPNVRFSRNVPLSLLATVTGSSVRFIREINGGLRPSVLYFPANAGVGAKTYDVHVPKGSKPFVVRELAARDYLAHN